jgi:hypothetical protein
MWSAPELISDGDTGVQGIPLVTADGHGNAMMLWVQDSALPGPDEDSNKQFSYARWRAGDAAWEDPQIITNGKNYDTYYYSAATAANGVTVVCYQDEGSYRGEATRPPQGFLNLFR